MLSEVLPPAAILLRGGESASMSRRLRTRGGAFPSLSNPGTVALPTASLWHWAVQDLLRQPLLFPLLQLMSAVWSCYWYQFYGILNLPPMCPSSTFPAGIEWKVDHILEIH